MWRYFEREKNAFVGSFFLSFLSTKAPRIMYSHLRHELRWKGNERRREREEGEGKNVEESKRRKRREKVDERKNVRE